MLVFSTIFRLDLGTVSTVLYILFSILFTNEVMCYLEE
jgi:hypothetical protein